MARFLQDAINTAAGHAHPINGTQLDVASGLPFPASYYKPNSGIRSFVDPSGASAPKQLVMFQREQLGNLAVWTAFANVYSDLTGGTSWTWGDGSDVEIGGNIARHVYAAAGSYTVSVVAQSDADGEVTASVTVPVGIDEGLEYPIQDIDG